MLSRLFRSVPSRQSTDAPSRHRPHARPRPGSGGRSGHGAGTSPAASGALRQGFSTERLERIDSTFERLVDRGEMAGAVVLVLRDGEAVYERAFGWADREAGRRTTLETMFRTAPQTKAITSVAVMALVEEGRISLRDPVSR